MAAMLLLFAPAPTNRTNNAVPNPIRRPTLGTAPERGKLSGKPNQSQLNAPPV